VTALRLTGGAVSVVDDVMQAFNAPSTALRTGARQFDVSPSGPLAYAPGGLFSGELRSLEWVDRTGNIRPLALPQREYRGPRLVPDNQRLAFYVYALATRSLIGTIAVALPNIITRQPPPLRGFVLTPLAPLIQLRGRPAAIDLLGSPHK
jgi:hypothetical protein